MQDDQHSRSQTYVSVKDDIVVNRDVSKLFVDMIKVVKNECCHAIIGR